MNRLLAKLWDKRERQAKADKGFTLIELLVVVVILGVLIAIAIPLYLNYRKGANDAAAESDLKNAINVLEQCNADNSQYPASLAVVGAGLACKGTISSSSGTTFLYTPSPSTGTVTSYVLVSTNSSGSPKNYCYNSAVGGAIVQVATASATTCVAPV